MVDLASYALAHSGMSNSLRSLHVRVEPPEGGLRRQTFVKCKDMRSVAAERLIEKWGRLSLETMVLIEDRLRILLDL